jgi:hypothetical protein
MRTATLVEDLMGRKPEKRYAFIRKTPNLPAISTFERLTAG